MKIQSVTTVSGSAGGSTNEADVVLRVVGNAATVEEVRAFVAQAVSKASATDVLAQALRGLLEQCEKGFLVNHERLCSENRQENANACEAAMAALENFARAS